MNTLIDYDMSDAMSIMLQRGGMRDSKFVFPFPFEDEKKNLKALNQLLRRGYVKRVNVSGIDNYHRHVRSVGYVNYTVTQRGEQALGWV